MSCKDCHYWERALIPDDAKIPQEVRETEKKKGICRAHPPAVTAVVIPQGPGLFGAAGNQNLSLQVQGITFWPILWEHEGCGEFMPRVAKPDLSFVPKEG